MLKPIKKKSLMGSKRIKGDNAPSLLKKIHQSKKKKKLSQTNKNLVLSQMHK